MLTNVGDDINVVVNGKIVPAKHGERIVEIIRRNGIFMPSACYHRSLSETGHCGLCLTGARRRSSDDFTVVFGCTTTATDGMEINTDYRPAADKRQETLFMYLMTHPLDCAKCDKVGGCFLHKFATEMKFRGFTRMWNGKLEGVEYKTFGKNVLFDSRKCINCQRCIRFCRDILDEDILGYILCENGYKEVDLYPGKFLRENYALNVVDICPAGALMNPMNSDQPAEWELLRTPSIATESSVGINTYVLHKENRIYRIIPRENKYVNDCWMTDSAREECHYFNNKQRLRRVIKHRLRSHINQAVAYMVKEFLSHNVDVVCSGSMSLEEQFVLRRLLDIIVCDVHFLKKERIDDGFLMSDDGTPNYNGALLNKIISPEDVVSDLRRLNKKIQEGESKVILVINEELFDYGVSYAMPDDVELFYIGTEYEKTAKRSSVAVPVTTVFENTGTFINRDWRLQKFFQAVNPPNAQILPMWYVFSIILNVYFGSEKNDLFWLDDVWREMNKCVSLLEDIDFKNMSEDGILLKKS